MNPPLVAAAVILVALRFAGVTHPAFQAVAHCYVGGLLGAWLADRGRFAPLGWLALAMSVAEVVAFVLSKLN